MKEYCDKCGYKSAKFNQLFDYSLCEFCSYFAPKNKEAFEVYVNEKVNFKEIQTYRKQGFLGGMRQKKGMKTKALRGETMNRPPFGYEIKNNKLYPSKNSKIIEEIYEDFLKTNLSLNKFSKKYNLSINGLKKVLTNFTYLGKIKFDHEVIEGNHTPLISSTLFNQVQDKLENLKIKK